jgi:hypothetical protein
VSAFSAAALATAVEDPDPETAEAPAR